MVELLEKEDVVCEGGNSRKERLASRSTRHLLGDSARLNAVDDALKCQLGSGLVEWRLPWIPCK